MGPAAAVSLIQAYYQACLSYLFLRFNASMSILFLLGQKKHKIALVALLTFLFI